MKKHFIAALVLCCTFFLHAQTKNYVCVVRQQYYPSHVEFLEDLSSSLKKSGYSNYSEYVDSFLKGGFGSGFVYVDKDGTNYIITNRHVVSQAASASIEFENDDGSLTKYDNLSVYITDDDIDLAILKFSADVKPFKNGLSLHTERLTDGQDVVSAGFPGLGGEPVWQFGKGSVTNATARIKDMIDPSISTVIQHSAQVDGGNSGGPLLIEAKNSPAGYAVAGINTWKAVGREATNFAIPSALVLRLLENSKKAVDDEALKSERASRFKAALTESSNDYTSIVKFLSYEYVSYEGEDCLNDVLRHAPTDVINRVALEFSFNPIEGLRYAAAYNLFNELSGEDASDENLSKITWQKEHGLYRIASVANDGKKKNKAKDKKNSKSSDKKDKVTVSFLGLESPYLMALGIGADIPLKAEFEGKEFESKPGLDISFSLFPGRTGMFGVFFEFDQIKNANLKNNAFGAGAAFKVPLNFNLFCISPNAATGIKVAMDEPRLMQFLWELGLEAMFNFNIEYFRAGVNISYRQEYNSYNYIETFYDQDFKVNTNNVVIKLIAAYSFD